MKDSTENYSANECFFCWMCGIATGYMLYWIFRDMTRKEEEFAPVKKPVTMALPLPPVVADDAKDTSPVAGDANQPISDPVDDPLGLKLPANVTLKRVWATHQTTHEIGPGDRQTLTEILERCASEFTQGDQRIEVTLSCENMVDDERGYVVRHRIRILLPAVQDAVGYHHLKMIRTVCPRDNLYTGVWTEKSGQLRLMIGFDSVIDKPFESTQVVSEQGSSTHPVQ